MWETVTPLPPRRGVIARWMYRGGHPNRVATAIDRGWSTVGSAGWLPHRLVTLEVVGRRTGKAISVPLTVVNHAGREYFVAILGERSSWVANVRAAGGWAVLHCAGRQVVRLLEVPAADRAPVLKRFVRVARGARPHFPFGYRASVEWFEWIADQYPVFLLSRRRRSHVTTSRGNPSWPNATEPAPTPQVAGTSGPNHGKGGGR